jgi:hypothetical protein
MGERPGPGKKGQRGARHSDKVLGALRDDFESKQ